ncbi:uncharacterized protein ASCRUDRAFT_117660 [Ascoidea rubescens DSM 1968]|uniref:Uncharacterized protein n=1 Tax=Ascoidea rubescens DSM 1968 TaxID=1344418 RepID=A0A1D2VBS0_9ASCO|nr:hypothetical protein ASCRUDRAFT_117660 [Ascoidea rubescens DSM 1968]ODV58907.1 hypothetical protein ASCRUDRAFT_117660 [Ascoidea rubescens DSM 1968]
MVTVREWLWACGYGCNLIIHFCCNSTDCTKRNSSYSFGAGAFSFAKVGNLAWLCWRYCFNAALSSIHCGWLVRWGIYFIFSPKTLALSSKPQQTTNTLFVFNSLTGLISGIWTNPNACLIEKLRSSLSNIFWTLCSIVNTLEHNCSIYPIVK